TFGQSELALTLDRAQLPSSRTNQICHRLQGLAVGPTLFRFPVIETVTSRPNLPVGIHYHSAVHTASWVTHVDFMLRMYENARCVNIDVFEALDGSSGNFRLSMLRLGQPGSTPALVLPGGMAATHRKGVTAERFRTRFIRMSLVFALQWNNRQQQQTAVARKLDSLDTIV
ncbi:hypothetical protein CLF_113185, partial [Clonorchis sinensis]